MSIVGTRPPLISETNLYEPRHKVKDTEYCSPTIASLMWISEEERKISLKMYIDNDNIWVQIVLWGMILANICMLEEVFEDEMKIDSGLSVEM